LTRNGAVGFTVTEVIVALALGSWVALAAVAGYIFVTHGWEEQRERTRVQQNLASAVGALSSAVRLAGYVSPPYPPPPMPAHSLGRTVTTSLTPLPCA
jgi:Tfp pilus assembly protein PilW